VEGAKWDGKTTTAMRKANSVLKLGDTGVLRSSRQLAEMKDPSFLMALTGTGAYAYRRKDGVYVVPIGCLRY